MAAVPSSFFRGAKPVALVAGGAGFIGSHLCQVLLEKDLKVICLDNWLTGAKENIEHLKESSNFIFIEADISRGIPESVEKADYVIHLAGVEAYLNGEDISIETLDANSIGTKNLLELAKEKKAKFLLVSTLGVYSGNISAGSLRDYFGQERPFEGEFSQHEAKRFAEAITAEYAQKENVDARVVRLAHVYGPRMMLPSGGALANIIRQVLYGGPIVVPGEEELTLYPAYIDDVTQGISRAVFSGGTKNKIISLAGPKTTAFSLAQAVVNVVKGNRKLSSLGEPEIEFSQVEFPKQEFSEEALTAGREVISWTPHTNLEEGLVETLAWFLAHKSRIPKEKEAEEPASGASSFWGDTLKRPMFKGVSFGFKRKISSPFWVFLLLSIFLFWFFAFPFISLGLGGAQLLASKNAFLSGSSRRATLFSKGAAFWFMQAENGFLHWSKVPGLKNESLLLSQKSKNLRLLSRIAQEASLLAHDAKTFAQGVLGEEPFEAQELSKRLSAQLSYIERQLAFLEAELAGENLVVSLPLFPDITLGSKDEIKTARASAGSLAGILTRTGDLLGEEGKRTYLVLFQNNMELRPTGGFIGSFALLTFDQGRLINIEVQDIYTADGQLKGHVEPPEPIKKYLGPGEAAWFLRDSNWHPDFVISAKRAAWFIDKELGVEVHTVVGIDLELVKELIRAYGPLKLPDFNEEVTADNLYEKTQYAAEGNFFPGSRAKKDFLTALSRALLGEVLAREKEGKSQNLIPAARALFRALEGRHMAVWVDNPGVMQELSQVGWDGGLRSVKCINQESCFADYFMPVESNMGVNKANYFLERKFRMEANFEEEKAAHKLTISYKNNSQQGVWPGGDYKNYLRLFLPDKVATASATLVNPTTGEKKELSIEEEKERGGRVSLGVLFTVPSSDQRDFEFSWEIPIKQESLGELVLLWQKQLGLPQDAVSLRIVLPGEASLDTAFPQPSLISNSLIEYNTQLSRDLLFNIKWEDKSR